MTGRGMERKDEVCYPVNAVKWMFFGVDFYGNGYRENGRAAKPRDMWESGVWREENVQVPLLIRKSAKKGKNVGGWGYDRVRKVHIPRWGDTGERSRRVERYCKKDIIVV